MQHHYTAHHKTTSLNVALTATSLNITQYSLSTKYHDVSQFHWLSHQTAASLTITPYCKHSWISHHTTPLLKITPYCETTEYHTTLQLLWTSPECHTDTAASLNITPDMSTSLNTTISCNFLEYHIQLQHHWVLQCNAMLSTPYLWILHYNAASLMIILTL